MFLPRFLVPLSLTLFSTVSLALAAPTFLDDDAEPSCNVAFSLAPPANAPANSRFDLVFDWQDEKNFYSLECTPKSAAFVMTQNGTRRQLAWAPMNWSAKNSLTLQRRPWMMQLIANNHTVLRAYDATWEDGKIGVNLSGWNWKDARVQPVEAIFFNDDFTRAGGEGDKNWVSANGKWALSASSESINAGNANMSSNPFAYEVAAPSGAAFASSGRWFWDDYDARVSVKPNGSGAVGIAAYVQDAKNYLAFVWNAKDGDSARKLVKIVDGKETVLAQGSGAFLPRGWYEIGLRNSPGYVEALVDGVPVLRAKTDAFGQGGIGLLAQNMGQVAFDDVRVRSYDFYRQDFTRSNNAIWTPDKGNAWQSNGGDWQGQNGVLNSAPKAGEGAATRALVTGRPDWDGYQLLASAKADEKGAVGLVLGWRDDQNYTVFRWAGSSANLPYKNRQQLLRYYKGKAEFLSDEPLSIDKTADKDGFVRLALQLDAGALAVYANGELVAQAGDETLAAGRPGLYSQGLAPVEFKDVVMFFPPAPEKSKIAPRMEGDSYMVGWASATGEWPPKPGNSGLEFWNTGEFFGDATLGFIWKNSFTGNFEVALRAQRGEFGSGYILRGESGDGQKTIKWSLLRDGKALKSATSPITDLKGVESDEGAPLKISLQGRGILLSASGKPLLSYLDENPLNGTTMAVRSSGFRVRADRLVATSQNRDDYTFTEAPTDFYSPQGKWHVFSRWPCYGDWSFFGGNGLNPVLWSKRPYAGDTVVEMYAHNQMDLPKEIGYSRPGDLNITLAGDGKNPSSGYSFVLAGWDNTRSAILRDGKVVAEKIGIAPGFETPINHVKTWHRRWFYIRAEARQKQKDGKTGVEISLMLDDAPFLTYFDPNPLPALKNGGRVAFWTTDGTVMIARAKIESASLGTKALPPGLLDAQSAPKLATNAPIAPHPLEIDDLASSVVSRDGETWKATNPESGGAFGLVLNGQILDANPNTKLQFDLKRDKDAKIDLYAQIGEFRQLIEIAGETRKDAAAPFLAKADKTARSDGWETISVNLGAELAKKFPNQKTWKIEQLALGALHGDRYRYVGFDGNPMGASYSVSNVRWE